MGTVADVGGRAVSSATVVVAGPERITEEDVAEVAGSEAAPYKARAGVLSP